MKMIACLPAIVFIVFFSLTGCNGKDPATGGPGIATGKPVQLINAKADQTGILYVDKPGDSLSGLMMFIPDAGFAASRRFSISYEPILHHSLGADFNPISPLITISCGGGFSDSIITMEIPIRLPEGKFAMGFLYDDRTGQLEGMPLLKLDAERAVVALRNFEHSYSLGVPMAAQVSGSQPEAVTKIVISAVDEKSLRPGMYESGFKPGVDDCPNVNYGSTIAPNGHCSGQSEFMLWYYANKKKKGAPGLYSLLEADGAAATPGFWEDDTKAIRLSSLVQDAWYSKSAPRRFMWDVFDFAGIMVPDFITFNSFAYAIRLTKEPQYICIAGKVPGYEDSTVYHAMVIYKTEEDKMYVADPNFPGSKARKIFFDNTRRIFLHYNTSSRANLPGMNFTDFRYVGGSALVSPDTPEKYWKEMEAGKLGEGRFPDFKLSTFNETGSVPLEDGFELKASDETGSELSVNMESAQRLYYTLYKDAPQPERAFGIRIKLTPGEHRVGICVADTAGGWAGFKWVKVKVVKEEKIARPKADIKPPFGELTVMLKINGTRFELEKCNFSAGEGYFTLEGPAESTTYRIRMRTDSFKGEGEYKDLSFNWMSNQESAFLGDYMNKKNGSLTISKWGEGKIEGVFSFEAYDDYYKKTIQGEGYFAYKLPEK